MRWRRLAPPKRRWIGYIGEVGLLACGSGPDERSRSPGPPAGAPGPADSLVATGPSGLEIWFTLAREATGADGTRCIERGIEIRRGATRLKVPLLYTGSAPVLLNDSTLRAVLWTHCRPGDAYLVNLRTGQPVRERAGGNS
jgi:hypothetical protein